MFNFPAPATSWHKLCCWEESHATHTNRCNGRTSYNCELQTILFKRDTWPSLSLRIYFLWLILILTRLLEKAAPVTGMGPINSVKNIEWWEVSDGAKQTWYFKWWVMNDEWWKLSDQKNLSKQTLRFYLLDFEIQDVLSRIWLVKKRK